MPNNFITPSVVARTTLMLLRNNMVAANLFHRGHTQEFTGAKVGDTVTVSGPATFEAKEFAGSTVTQDIDENGVSLVLEKHFDVTVGVTSKEWTLELDKFAFRVIRPAALALAEAVDKYILGKAVEVANHVGTAGSPPDTLAKVTEIGEQLDINKVPMDGRFGIVNPTAKAKFLQIPEATQADKRGDAGTALRKASMGEFLGLDWFMGQNVYSHTAGTASADSPLAVNGAVAEDAVIMNADSATGTNTLVAGDVFTVAGAPGHYRVTANIAASTGAFTGIAFEPAAPAGGFADNAAITVIGNHVANLAGHGDGLTAAIVPLELPRGAANAEYIGDEGLGIRVVYDYDSDSKKDTISFDLLCGAKAQQPELLTRVLG